MIGPMWTDGHAHVYLEPGEVALVAEQLRRARRPGPVLHPRDLLLQALADALGGLPTSEGIVLGPACSRWSRRAALALMRGDVPQRPVRTLHDVLRPEGPAMATVAASGYHKRRPFFAGLLPVGALLQRARLTDGILAHGEIPHELGRAVAETASGMMRAMHPVLAMGAAVLAVGAGLTRWASNGAPTRCGSPTMRNGTHELP